MWSVSDSESRIQLLATPTEPRDQPADGSDQRTGRRRLLALLTYIYCHPSALETEAGRVAVDNALRSLASELALGEGAQLREPGGNSITVRDVEPRDLWKAMDRAVPNWEDQHLFFAPVFFDPG